MLSLVLLLMVTAVECAHLPVPNSIQSKFMDFETIQFMHFGIPTFWDPPKEYLYQRNPTYHDCSTTRIDKGPQTEGYWPCLNPNVSATSLLALHGSVWIRQSHTDRNAHVTPPSSR